MEKFTHTHVCVCVFMYVCMYFWRELIIFINFNVHKLPILQLPLFYCNCGDQLPLEVLFSLNRLGLWPNDPVRGRRHIRGRSTKVEMEITLQEELKGIYNRPKPIRGEKSPRNICPRWLETSLSPWYTVLREPYDRRGQI